MIHKVMCYDGYQTNGRISAPEMTVHTKQICFVKPKDGCMEASQHRNPPNRRGDGRIQSRIVRSSNFNQGLTFLNDWQRKFPWGKGEY